MIILKQDTRFGSAFARLRHFGILAVCVAAFLPLNNDVQAITDCSAAYALTPDSAATSECTVSPCNPGNCTYTPASGTGLGTFSAACGPITKCVLSGDDPPLGDPQWDEPPQGFQGAGATLMTGKCAPPKKADGFQLMCPAAGYIPTSR